MPGPLGPLLQGTNIVPTPSTATSSQEHKPMDFTTTTFGVTGMTCGHCVRSVKGELGKLDGVTDVVADKRLS